MITTSATAQANDPPNHLSLGFLYSPFLKVSTLSLLSTLEKSTKTIVYTFCVSELVSLLVMVKRSAKSITESLFKMCN